MIELGIEIPTQELHRAYTWAKSWWTYNQNKEVFRLLRLHPNIDEAQSEADIYTEALEQVYRRLAPAAREGWISLTQYDPRTNSLFPVAIYPSVDDPRMLERVFRELTYDLNQSPCKGVVALCAQDALEWLGKQQSVYPEPHVVDDVWKVPHYREIDDRTRSEAAIALFWGSRFLGVVNFESRSKRAFRRKRPILNAIARTLERFYGFYEAGTLGCSHSINELIHLDPDAEGGLQNLMNSVCRIVANAVKPAAIVSYMGVWTGESFSRDRRAYYIYGPQRKLNRYLRDLELRSDGISFRVLESATPIFELRSTGKGTPIDQVLSDETLFYMLEAPPYIEGAKKPRSCSVLPLLYQGAPVGVIWMLFERGANEKITAAEKTHLTCVANMAGNIVGTAINQAKEKEKAKATHSLSVATFTF